MEQRIFVMDKNGKQHQSWNLDGKGQGMVLTCDIIPGTDLHTRWGMYTIKEYQERIKENDFIQSNIKKNPPKFSLKTFAEMF